LLLVMWILVLLSVIAGQFCYTMRTELNIVRNFKEETQAYYIARAGLIMAIAGLVSDRISPKKSTSDFEVSDDDAIRWQINTDIPPIEFAQGHVMVRIENESGKININRAGRKVLHQMLHPFDLDTDTKSIIVDSILDWRDKDNLHRANGAEFEYYKTMDPPYPCKNGDFETGDELLMVRGISPELYYNGLRKMVSVIQENPSGSVKKKKKSKKMDYNKINLNAAPPQVLRALPMMTDELVEMVIDYRKDSDIEGFSGLIPLVGPDVYRAILPYLTLSFSPFYSIRSVGMVAGSRTKQGVQAIVKIDPKLENKYHLIQWMDGIDTTI